MKKKTMKLTFYSILLSGIIFACHKEELRIEDNASFDAISARNWFESNHSPEIKMQSEKFSKGIIIGVPDWEHAVSLNHKDSKTIEIPLKVTNDFSFSTEESYRAAKESGDERFMKSQTKLIIENTKTGTNGFLMTIIPDKSYLENKKFDAFNSTYKNWQNEFTGYVLYHNLDGSFSNGWKFSEGFVEKPVNYSNLNKSNKSENCYYYFLVYTITECGSYITKGNNGCITYEEWYYIGNDCVAGGGGSGGYTGYTTISVQEGTPNADLIYNLSSTLTPEQKQLLEAAIVGFINEFSISRSIWETLVNLGVSIKFEIDSTLSAAARIVGNTITFREESTITTASVREELIHRYQTHLYGGLAMNYQNYEFEAKLLQDLMYYMKYDAVASQTAGYFDNDTDIVDYMDWLEYIKITGLVDANILNDFCSKWHYPGAQNGNVDYYFSPGVINTFIHPTGIIY